LPSNGEEPNKNKLTSFVDASPPAGIKPDKNDFVRNSLKKQILSILSTDDEEDEINESSHKIQTERINQGERLVAILLYMC